MELRATEDRTHEMEAEVEHWREPAARPEQWLRTIQNEIEEKLLPRRLFSDAEEVAWVSSGDPLFRQQRRLGTGLSLAMLQYMMTAFLVAFAPPGWITR